MRFRIFISYAHENKFWLDELETMLKPAVRSGLTIWSDREIKSGTIWRDETEDALATSQSAILLVSKYFLASDFISKNELPPLLEAARTEGLVVHWLAVGDCLFEFTPIPNYNALISPAEPLNCLSEGERDKRLKRAAWQVASTTPVFSIILDQTPSTINGRELTITGKVEMRSVQGEEIGNISANLQAQHIDIVPIVNTYGWGFHKQTPATIRADGKFGTVVHCGNTDPVTRPTNFAVFVCAMSQKFNNSLRNPMWVRPRQALSSDSFSTVRMS